MPEAWPSFPTPSIGTSMWVTEASYIVYQDTIGGVARTISVNGLTGAILGYAPSASYATPTALIQATINALTGGGAIFIKAGTYMITTAINLLSNIELWGEGNATVLSCTLAIHIINALSKSNIVVRDMRLVGPGTPVEAATADGIHFDDVSDSTIENCWIEDTRNNNIRLENCVRCHVKGNHLTNGWIGVSSDSSSYTIVETNQIYSMVSHGIDNYDCDYPLIMGNTIQDGLMGGMSFDGSRHGIITDNIVRNCAEVGVVVTPAVAIRSEDFIISDNQIIDITKYDGTFGHGILISSSDRGIISNNLIKNCEADGILVRVGCTNVVLDGNFVHLSGNIGINISDSAYTQVVDCWVSSSTGNNILVDDTNHVVVQGSTSISAGASGIAITNSSLCEVTDNYVEASTGDQIYIATGDNHIVTDNFVIDTADGQSGIIATVACYCQISDNYIYNSTAAGRTGINLWTNVDCYGNKLLGNYFVNCATAINIVVAQEIGTEVFHNTFISCTICLSDSGTDTKLPEIQGVIDIGLATTTIGDGWGVNLPDLADTHVRINWNVPPEFQELVRCRILVIPLGTGNMAYSVATDFGKRCVEVYTTHTGTKALGTQVVTINEIECIDVDAALAGLALSDFVLMDFLRDGDDESDTVGAACVLVGAYMQYV